MRNESVRQCGAKPYADVVCSAYGDKCALFAEAYRANRPARPVSRHPDLYLVRAEFAFAGVAGARQGRFPVLHRGRCQRRAGRCPWPTEQQLARH